MAVTDLAGLVAAIGPAGRLLGLDVGSKTVGLALSDPLRRVASPLQTLRRTQFTAAAQQLADLAAAREVRGLIVGLPVNMNGTEGPRCQSVRQFVRNLEAHLDLPTAFWDERLSTAAVTRMLLEADMSRRRRRQVVDKLAAAYILQGALDGLVNTRTQYRGS